MNDSEMGFVWCSIGFFVSGLLIGAGLLQESFANRIKAGEDCPVCGSEEEL